jgi:hypothetical protein
MLYYLEKGFTNFTLPLLSTNYPCGVHKAGYCQWLQGMRKSQLSELTPGYLGFYDAVASIEDHNTHSILPFVVVYIPVDLSCLQVYTVGIFLNASKDRYEMGCFSFFRLAS